MESSRQEYWSGLPFPSPGDLPDTGIKRMSLCLWHWKVDSLPLQSPYWYILVFIGIQSCNLFGIFFSQEGAHNGKSAEGLG